MKLKPIEIIADLNYRSAISLENINVNEIVEALIKTGNEVIILRGILLEQFDNGILIFADDDIQSLIIEYLVLEKKTASKNPYEHGEFLNGGVLSFTAECDGENVKLDLRYCPEVNIINLVEKSVLLTSDEYLWWWRSIAHAIHNIGSGLK